MVSRSALAAPLRVSSVAPAWSIVPTPSPQVAADGALSGVACPTTARCVAVGHFENFDDEDEPFVGQSSGASWTLVAAPVPPLSSKRHGDPGGHLFGVACATGTKCFGVGSYFDGKSTRSLIEAWNGSAWSVVARPNPASAASSLLSGVSCPTRTSCFAVGSYLTGRTTAKTMIERWNGKVWSMVTSPDQNAHSNALAAIACVSAASCFAVGHYNGSVTGTLIERWNGSSWTIVKSPNPSGATTSQLAGIACPGVAFCWAVGSGTGTLVERWNGSTWSIVKGPNPSGATSLLSGVSCISTTSCIAVGAAGVGPLVERWNGTAWSIGGSAVSATGPLDAISCTSSTECTAVGGTHLSVIARLVGTAWTIIPAGASFSTLSLVSCSSGTSCYAIGQTGDGIGQDAQPLFQHWDGSHWSILASPSDVGFEPAFGLSCPTSTRCFAAYDVFTTGSGPHSEIEEWDGTQWSAIGLPGPAGADAVSLRGISCVSSTSCFVVGSYNVGSGGGTLIERWNGTAWSIIPSPSPVGATTSQLASVSCTSATSCFAVGEFVRGTGHTLAERWNGTAWSIVASPDGNGATLNSLSKVSCASAVMCLAVGSNAASVEADSTPLIERWNGASWVQGPSPVPADVSIASIADVSCPAVTACYSLAFEGEGINNTRTARWNGTSWSTLAGPNSSLLRYSSLSSISCVSAVRCVAVGTYETPTDSSFSFAKWTLAEQYS